MQGCTASVARACARPRCLRRTRRARQGPATLPPPLRALAWDRAAVLCSVREEMGKIRERLREDLGFVFYIRRL
jgi:hypothetical protein